MSALACADAIPAIPAIDLEGHHLFADYTDRITSLTAINSSPDQRLLAAATQDNRILIWDLRRRTRTTTLTGHTTPPTTLAFSPDGTTLAAASGNTINLWDLTTRTLSATLTGHTGTITTLTYHPDGTTLASAATDHTTRLWNLNPHTALTYLTN